MFVKFGNNLLAICFENGFYYVKSTKNPIKFQFQMDYWMFVARHWFLIWKTINSISLCLEILCVIRWNPTSIKSEPLKSYPITRHSVTEMNQNRRVHVVQYFRQSIFQCRFGVFPSKSDFHLCFRAWLCRIHALIAWKRLNLNLKWASP